MTIISIVLVGRTITIQRAIKKRSKELIPKIKKRRLIVITLQGATEKSFMSQDIHNSSVNLNLDILAHNL